MELFRYVHICNLNNFISLKILEVLQVNVAHQKSYENFGINRKFFVVFENKCEGINDISNLEISLKIFK